MIGSVFDQTADPSTLDRYMKRFVNRATVGWVACFLERAGVGQSFGVAWRGCACGPISPRPPNVIRDWDRDSAHSGLFRGSSAGDLTWR